MSLPKKAIEIIKKARKAKKLTQPQVAALLKERLGRYSHRHYQNLERGKFPIYKEKVISVLEEILDIKISELIYGNNEANDSDPEPYLNDSPNNTTSRPGELIYVSAFTQVEYPAHFQDPTFISKLPQIRLPDVAYQGEQYRLFEVQREDTARHRIGDYLICNRIELHPPVQVIDFDLYIVIRQADVIMGWLAAKKDEPDVFALQNPNTNFSRQIRLTLQDIKELWHAKRTINNMEPIIRRFNIDI